MDETKTQELPAIDRPIYVRAKCCVCGDIVRSTYQEDGYYAHAACDTVDGEGESE